VGTASPKREDFGLSYEWREMNILGWEGTSLPVVQEIIGGDTMLERILKDDMINQSGQEAAMVWQQGEEALAMRWYHKKKEIKNLCESKLA
jgi:hypothetical protein